MKKICIIYPRITNYILPVVRGLSNYCHVDFISSPVPNEEGFGEHSLFDNEKIRWISVKDSKPFGKKFGFFQHGLIPYMIRQHPDVIIINANPRYLSLWYVLLAGKILKIPIYLRGHGIYKRERTNNLYKFMYRCLLGLSYKYLCYTENVKISLLPLVSKKEKLIVDYNTLYNDFPVTPEEKTGKERGILFIGRLRQRTGIEILIEVVKSLRKEYLLNIDLHVIGDGILGEWMKTQAKQYPWMIYHGMIYDDEKIQKISRKCRFGVFPGDAGLSVVHMMSLSLPPLTHDKIQTHMGPEPSYIRPGDNGWLYSKLDGSNALRKAILEIIKIPPEGMKKFQRQAFNTFDKLNHPPYHERLWALINLP